MYQKHYPFQTILFYNGKTPLNLTKSNLALTTYYDTAQHLTITLSQPNPINTISGLKRFSQEDPEGSNTLWFHVAEVNGSR